MIGRTRMWAILLAAMLLAGIAAAAAVVVVLPPGVGAGELVDRWKELRTGDTLRYVERRLEGHPKLQAVSLPVIRWVRSEVERPVPPGPLPTLGKGQQAETLEPLRSDALGRPQPTLLHRQAMKAAAEPAAEPGTAAAAESPGDVVSVTSVAALEHAIETARPGQVVELAPGTYRLQRSLSTARAGVAGAPIVVRAAAPRTVTLESPVTEAIVVRHEHWHFENLTMRGVCKRHDDCEHAFHVVGAAFGTVLRNNHLEDFNAHLKVNGEGGRWPDHGLVEFNTLTNTDVRTTEMPVSPVDIVGANGWRVVDNVISHFVKRGGNGVSYGAFMKGGGEAGRFERNLVVCARRDLSQPGERVGLSFGNGGTGAAFCRDGRCEFEHANGQARANVVAHCNDSGIDVNGSRGITVADNTLINTAGIDVRDSRSIAAVSANLMDGLVRARDRSVVMQEGNERIELQRVLVDPDALDLRWIAVRKGTQPSPLPLVNRPQPSHDFCGRLLGSAAPAGAQADDCRTP